MSSIGTISSPNVAAPEIIVQQIEEIEKEVAVVPEPNSDKVEQVKKIDTLAEKVLPKEEYVKDPAGHCFPKEFIFACLKERTICPIGDEPLTVDELIAASENDSETAVKKSDQDDEFVFCPINFEQIEEEGKCTPCCETIFSKEGIEMWLKKSSCCPMCNHEGLTVENLVTVNMADIVAKLRDKQAKETVIKPLEVYFKDPAGHIFSKELILSCLRENPYCPIGDEPLTESELKLASDEDISAANRPPKKLVPEAKIDYVKATCGHIFDREVIRSWLDTHFDCPLDGKFIRAYDLRAVSEEEAKTSKEVRPTIEVKSKHVEATCGHVFDREVISAWLKTHDCCPLDEKYIREIDFTPVTEEFAQRCREVKPNFLRRDDA